MGELVGRRYKTAQGRESYEIHKAESAFIFKIATVLESQFGCAFSRPPVIGPDGVYWECYKGDLKYAVGWDIWSGCYVFAESPEGDASVIQFGEYLDQVLNDL